MKKLVENNFIRKTILALCVVLVIAFSLPQRVYADDDWSIGGTLLKEIMKLIASLGDIGMATLNTFMLGADGFTSAMISKDDQNLDLGSGSWLTDGVDANDPDAVQFSSDEINASFLGLGEDYQIPNMLFSPENIFANNIAALDVNFLHPNEYTSVIEGRDEADNASVSAASDLREVISSWYRSFRNIAIVGLLSVLIYLGIRIMISSTADDKAKYKESIKNWVVALCLVFIIHFIMSAILMITDRVTDLFATSINSGFTVSVDDGKVFRTNLTGLIRFQAQRTNAQEATAYTIMYMVLVVYTFRFTFMYFKRFLYTAFFTMIAPLVALTYPIDKAGDGKAQAFNMWFKEYTMNVIIQPVHLILYTVFVSSAIDLVQKNPIYAIVAIGFLIPAEKFIKKMFGLDKAESTGDFGSFAGGAIAMSALQSATKLIGKDKKGKSSSGKSNSGDDDDGEQAKIFTPPNRKQLGSYSNGARQGGDSEDSDSERVRQEQEAQEQARREQEEEQRRQQEEEEERRRQEAMQQYMDQGGMYGQNENGDYYNPYIDDFDPDYDPSTDPANGYESIDTTEIDSETLPEDAESQETLPPPGGDSTDSSTQPDNQNLRNLADNGKPEVLPGARKKLAIKGAKSLAKGSFKVLKKAAPYVVGGAVGAVGTGVGFAVGVATGKPSNAFQYAATGAGLGAGVGVGASKGIASLGKGTANAVTEKVEDIQYAKDEAYYGQDYAIQQKIERANSRARREFLKDEQQQEKYQEMAQKLGYKGELNDFMNAAFDMRVAGVKSKEAQENALKLEMKRDNGQVGGASHENVTDAAAFISKNGYTKDNIEDAKKREVLEGVVQSIVPGEDNQMAVMTDIAGLVGREDYYKKHSGIRSNNSTTTTQASNSSNSQPRVTNGQTTNSSSSQSRGANRQASNSGSQQAPQIGDGNSTQPRRRGRPRNTPGNS